MEKITGKEPAYPTDIRDSYSGKISSQEIGLSIRQEFAARAMQGIVTAVYSSKAAFNDMTSLATSRGIDITELIANNSLHIADSLISCINKPATTDQYKDLKK